MIQNDFDYYSSHQDEITAGHIGQFVVIKDTGIIGYFDREKDAFEAMKGNELGTFLVKKCQASGTDVITYFNNRVRFA